MLARAYADHCGGLWSFLLAEEIHASAVLGVVVAGMVLGNYGRRTGMSVSTSKYVDAFWKYAAFVVSSLVFLLIGLQVQLPLLIKYAPQIGVAIIAILVSRLIVVFGFCPLLSRKNVPISPAWRLLLFGGR